MRALVIHSPKDLRLEDQPNAAPGPDEVAVDIYAGGICGSDLHYYHHGGFGAIRLREPMIPGHEIAGKIAAVGSHVNHLNPGDSVAINPSLPCLDCQYCRIAQFNQCLDMRFYGSAMRFPHIQGAFSQRLICKSRQCITLPANTNLHHAAFSEPLAVALHGVNRASEACGGITGKRVFVSGCGPIGLLTLMAARHAGAAEIIAADVSDHVLAVAQEVGANNTINVATNSSGLEGYQTDKGYFDVAFEASGVESAIKNAMEIIKPRGTLVQLGLGGDVSLGMNVCVAKEIQLIGSFRFHEEFQWAANLIANGAIDVRPLLSATFPMDRAHEAFELAGDRSQAIKVQIAFTE